MKIGVFGGTFDPIHYGHLVAAAEVRWALDLQKVLFVPAGLPPHKLLAPVMPVEQRVAMVELAIADNVHFALSRVDVDRPGPAYSVDMLSLLQQQWGPEAELYFIVGLDSLQEISTWHQAQKLLSLARLAVVSRPGFELPDLTLMERTLPGLTESLNMVSIPALDISSSDLRRRIANAQPIRYQLPDAVAEYIDRHGLYR